MIASPMGHVEFPAVVFCTNLLENDTGNCCWCATMHGKHLHLCKSDGNPREQLLG